MPHPKPAEGNVALIRPPEGAVAAAAPASEADDRWVWFEDEHGERFRVPRSWVQGTPADASNAGGSAEEADPDEAGGIHIKNPTLSRMFEGVRLTSGQASLVPKLQAFLDDDEARIFILRGYAGTGKTFLMKGVVDYLSAVNRSVHLMAPTGRAAKVLSTRTSRSPSTIHAHLYSPRDRDDPDDEDFTLVSDLTSNTDELDAVYVVDEASMVSDRETQNPLLQFGSGRLLADLLHFLEDAPCAHRRHILFVGDAAQLPPVGMTVSPALSPVHLEEEFGLKPSEHTLTDIVRQKQDSGILALATALRTGLKNKTYALPRLPADVPDVERIDARDMARLCWEVMGRRITRDAVMIAQTNVRAQQLNRAFRRLQFPGVEELAAGDKLMVILNTHMHGEFICNGDFCQVLRTGARTRRSVSFRVKTGPAGKGRRLVNLDLEFQSVVLGRSFVRTDGGTASTRGALCRRRHVDDPRRGRSGSARSCSLRTYFGLSLGAGALRGFAQLRKPRESAALKDRDVQKNPDYADCRQCRPGHKTRCPRSSDTSLAMCLQTMPPDIVVAEVDRILAGRADASLPVSARTPDLSTKPD